LLSTLGLSSDVLGRYEQVVDFAYSRSTTALLKAARQFGARTTDGLDILVAQGGLSFELWTGRRAPLGAMRQAAAGG
jgi:shikimate dehydrogenase